MKNKTIALQCSLILYVVSYYYIFLAAINDGATGYAFGIPFGLFLVWEILFSKIRIPFKIIHLLFLVFAISFNAKDRTQMKIIYPLVGTTLEITKEVPFSYGDFYINNIELIDEKYTQEKERIKFKLTNGDVIKINRQILSGNPDLGVDYTFEIESEAFAKIDNYITNNLGKIKEELSKSFMKYFSRQKTEFYYGAKRKFYIDDSHLHDLFKSQKIYKRVHESNRFRNFFTFMSFYIIIYFPVLIIFFLIVKARNAFLNKAMSGDSKIPLPKRPGVIFSIVLVALIPIVLFVNDRVGDKDLSREIDKRYNFLKQITIAVEENQLISIDNKSAIEMGIAALFYKVNNDSIVHGYEGEIYIESNSDGIAVEYSGIPGGDPCFEFYFMNSPKVFGFRRTFVDGKLAKTGSNTRAIKQMKKKFCCSGQKKVTVRYEATFKQLESAARFIKKMESRGDR